MRLTIAVFVIIVVITVWVDGITASGIVEAGKFQVMLEATDDQGELVVASDMPFDPDKPVMVVKPWLPVDYGDVREEKTPSSPKRSKSQVRIESMTRLLQKQFKDMIAGLKHRANSSGRRLLAAPSSPSPTPAIHAPTVQFAAAMNNETSVDPVTGNTVLSATIFIQRSLTDQMVFRLPGNTTEAVFENGPSLAPCEPKLVSDTCKYSIRIRVSEECNDISFASKAFSNLVWCQQQITYMVVDPVEDFQILHAVFNLPAIKLFTGTGYCYNTTLSNRLFYSQPNSDPTIVDYFLLDASSVFLFDHHNQLLDPVPVTQQQSSQTQFIEGQEMCALVRVDALDNQPFLAPNASVVLDVDLVEVIMCTDHPVLHPNGVQLRPGDIDPLQACASYVPQMRWDMVYSRRTPECLGSAYSNSTHGGCCDPDRHRCRVFDQHFAPGICSFDSPLNATSSYFPRECTGGFNHPDNFIQASDFTPSCPSGTSCSRGPLQNTVFTLKDIPASPQNAPRLCFSNATDPPDFVDCTSSTSACADPATCFPSTREVAVCFRTPSLHGLSTAVLSDLTLDFRLDVRVMDIRESPGGGASSHANQNPTETTREALESSGGGGGSRRRLLSAADGDTRKKAAASRRLRALASSRVQIVRSVESLDKDYLLAVAKRKRHVGPPTDSENDDTLFSSMTEYMSTLVTLMQSSSSPQPRPPSPSPRFSTVGFNDSTVVPISIAVVVMCILQIVVILWVVRYRRRQ